MPTATAAERLRELRALRDELRSAIAKVVPIKPPPSSWLSDDTIERFRTNMREALLSGGPLARTHLRFLVEPIDVKRPRGRRLGRAHHGAQGQRHEGPPRDRDGRRSEAPAGAHQ